MVEDARYRTKVFCDTYLTAANILKDDATSQAAFAVIFKKPPYPMIKEYYASSSAVEVLFLIGKPSSKALLDTDQAPYGYEEHVPIRILCVDKIGVTGTKLKWTVEAELRRICENNPTGSYRYLEVIDAGDEDIDGTRLYGISTVMSYVRDTT